MSKSQASKGPSQKELLHCGERFVGRIVALIVGAFLTID